MQVDIEDSDNNKCIVRVNFPKTEVELETTSVAQIIQPKANVKGFRPGTAPLHIIKSFYRKPILREVSQRLVYRGTSDSLREKQLKNVSNPELLEEFRVNDQTKKDHIGTFNLDGSFSFAVSVELPPDVDVKDYLGVEVEVDTDTFDSWFEKKMLDAQLMYGDKQAAEDLSKTGDELIVDFHGFVGGEPLDNGGVESQRLVIGDGTYLEAFDAAFVGRKAGEEFSVTVKFPEDYNEEALRGKEVDFNCKVHEVNTIVPHELNDDLAQLLSYSNLEELVNDHKQIWQRDFYEPMRAGIFAKLMEKVAECNPFDLPEAWVNAEIEKRFQQIGVGNLANQPEAFNALKGLCEKSVRYAYLMDKIYEKETDIHLSSDEFLAIAEEEAQKMSISGTELVEKLKREGTYEGFVSFHEQKKVMNFLVDNAVLNSKEKV